METSRFLRAVVTSEAGSVDLDACDDSKFSNVSGAGVGVGVAAVRSDSPVQITSIDGFFNRKRGRPPKNRFVEVYKTAQQSPQAIFTSFKLEKSDINLNVSELHTTTTTTTKPIASISNLTNTATATTTINTTTKCSLLSIDQSMISSHSHSHDDLISPIANRNSNNNNNNSKKRKLSSEFFHEADMETNCKRRISDKLTNSSDDSLEVHRRPIGCVLFKNSEKISVVRAAGTFYPANCEHPIDTSVSHALVPTQQELVENSFSNTLQMTQETETVFNMYEDDEPEDLSMNRTSKAKTANNEASASSSTANSYLSRVLQLKQQLFSLYQQQQQQHQMLLPGYIQSLAASSLAELGQGTTLDEIAVAAKQKLLLLNMAAAAAAAAAVVNATSATTMSAVGPNSNSNSNRNINGKVLCKSQRDTPTGYLKFRFNEDCGFQLCGYRNHQSHFHCIRESCKYSFCDKTRFVQHTARHERLDSLMGDDFRNFRANMHCGYNSCNFFSAPLSTDKKSSHFHCLKCDYVCADTNKVVAHRRLHHKMEFIRSAGFCKVASNESCPIQNTNCSYALKHTHYHCLSCDCSVLSRAQLRVHKHKAATPLTTSTSRSDDTDKVFS